MLSMQTVRNQGIVAYSLRQFRLKSVSLEYDPVYRIPLHSGNVHVLVPRCIFEGREFCGTSNTCRAVRDCRRSIDKPCVKYYLMYSSLSY